jgi:23S rRNA (guanosine2251-2'-O)-methyltransferase
MKAPKIYIYGRHAVGEALRNAPQTLREIYLAPTMQDRELKSLITRSGIPVQKLDPARASSQVERNAPHQGVIALVHLGELIAPFDHFLDHFEATPETCLVFVSEVQDPHNVGAIIRSAAAFGATAVLMPTHNQSPVTGVVVKSSAGMAFRVPLIAVENSQQAIAQLKKKGVQVYGLAADAKQNIADESFEAPTCLFLVTRGGYCIFSSRTLRQDAFDTA